AAAFGCEVIRIVSGREAIDRYAGDALHRFRDAAIRQRPDVLGGDRIDEHLGFALDLLRVLEAVANARDADFLDAGIRLRMRSRILRGAVGAGAANKNGKRRGAARIPMIPGASAIVFACALPGPDIQPATRHGSPFGTATMAGANMTEYRAL